MPCKYRPRTKKQATDPIVEDAFRDDEIICLICGKGGMKTLARHLNFIHNLKPTEYRKLFGIKSMRPLTSKNYEQSRREFVQQKQSPDLVEKARAAKAARLLNGKEAPPAADSGSSAKRGYRRARIFGQGFTDRMKALRGTMASTASACQAANLNGDFTAHN